MGKLTAAAGRREFLKGAAMIGAAVAAKCGMAMQPGEQKAWDKYNAMKIPRPEGLLEGEPVLQVPAPDSMGVAFAVTALANGFAELADNPGMEKPVRFMAEGMPLAGIDDRVLVSARQSWSIQSDTGPSRRRPYGEACIRSSRPASAPRRTSP